MAVNWTKEQTQVIWSRDRNLLVSAAAGSGKTAVLVERIIQMITDPEHPVDIDQLLVMTFTNAAAAEMRERVGAAIDKKLESDPDNEHLQQQATLVQYAQITTIDSFCLHILREHFNYLDIDPSFRIGEEGELLLMQRDVMRELLEDCYQEADPAFTHFVDTYSVGKADGGIEDYIRQVYDFSQSNPWPGQWLESLQRELEHLGESGLEEMEWIQFLLKDVRNQATEWVEQLSEAALVCQEENGPLPYLPMIVNDKRKMEELLTVETYGQFVEAASKLTFDKLAAVRSKEIDKEKKEFVSACRSRIKKGVEKMGELYLFASPKEIVEDMNQTREDILALLCLAEKYADRYQAKKREKNIVDFNDLEHFALEILTVHDQETGEWKPGEIADEMSRQYVEVLVDEYQDSNLVQETLIKCVSRERFDAPNVFMVGDVKQSIYKFRLARPELFLEKYNTYSQSESKRQKIELHQNFRSRETVLESINHIFFGIMTEKLGNIEYTEETALHPGAVFEPEEQGNRTTELLLANTNAEVMKQLDEDTADYTGKEIEARMIALKIRELTDGKDGLLVWDKKTEGYRRARYSDIVILLRSVSGWAEAFIDVLSREGIPAFAESRTGYFNTIEVETVLNMLSVIDNPMQDIPLASVLKSPIVGLSDRELAEMTAVFKKTPEKGRDWGIYGAYRNYLTLEEDEMGIRDKLVKFSTQLEQFRREMAYLPIHQLIYHVFEQTGYYDYISAMPAGDNRRANLDMLVEKAAAYEKTSYKGLFHFIRYIGNLKKYNTDFGEAAMVSEHDNTVRIMSIHKSKGLEFPIVILAGLGKMFNKQDVRGKILIDPELGIGVDFLDTETRIKAPTLKKNVLKRRMDLENMGEELRVLYVALTRAKEKLIMTAVDKSLDTRMEKWRQITSRGRQIPFTILSTAGSYLDLVLMSLSRPTNRIEVIQVPVESLLTDEIGRQVQKKISKSELLNFDYEKVYDEAYRRCLEQSFSFLYPYAEDLKLHTKMTVSELKKEGQMTDEMESDFLPCIPRFLDEVEETEGGATRGTAYHRAMELLDFSLVSREEDVKRQLLDFKASGKLSEAVYQLLDIPMIYRFFLSPLGERMAKAQAEGRLHKEQQFVIGIPACEMGQGSSRELVLIQGIVDAYFENDDGIVLVDYKTDRVPKRGGKKILTERYQMQLDYYKRALEQMLGRQVSEKIIYSYHIGEVRL